MTLYLGGDIGSIDGDSTGNRYIDWTAAYLAGMKFVFFRGSYGAWKDPTFNREAARARHAGLIVGAYLFPLFGKDAPEPDLQIDCFAANVDVVAGRDFVPVLDVEFPGGIKKTGRTREDLMARVLVMKAKLDARFRVKCMLYTSARVWDGTDEDSLDAPHTVSSASAADLHASPLWLARYPFKSGIAPFGDDASEKPGVEALPLPPVPAAWGKGNLWIHQYQGDAIRFPGFSSTADLNRFFDLKHGDAGERVVWVAAKLGLSSDGTFNDAVSDAVKTFQRTSNLVADGIVGPKTFAALSWK